ncbi:MAG TPA: UDP-N-acetylmuramoyl-L-alanyl-D-glutamate--2,6-diaminopimelate ligase [Fimbriimonadaceae bacterium]|nr:UDP-N-acetylmuramoyl-L-alanyl-D-glutamate--2,6-diaminopimelate ligase [Fimbriimonadaceae bacterium]
MTIHELFRQSGVEAAKIEGDADVSTMTMDSRRAKPGAMFVCMPSKNSDSNAFIGPAHEKGASSVLTFSAEGFQEARRLGMSAALLPEDMYQDSLWKLCKVAFGNPSASMKVIGVTGTNGKTTTAWLIRDMLKALGVKAAYLGTLGFQLPGEERELNNTTPFAIELNELLAEAQAKGVEAIAMEVSSHALAEKRVDGIEFDAAVFTNLTQDHLDFHGSMEEYEAAKLRLFTELPKQSSKQFVGMVNADDPVGQAWAERYNLPTFGILPEGTEFYSLNGTPLEVTVDHIRMEIGSLGQADGTFTAPLGGSYNVENLLSASAGLLALRESTDIFPRSQTVLSLIASLAEQVRPVPGRFEAVRNDAGIGILVDYAHTPDAVEKLLDAVRPLTKGRIITVFGCGGDRDRTKRPKMAKAASERSDVTVITSDNPRTEDPVAIVEEVAAGIDGIVDWSHVPGRAAEDTHGRAARATVIVDRGEAIAYAIRVAKPGDVVVIAGKGHENYQIIGRVKHPMDDRELAREALASY